MFNTLNMQRSYFYNFTRATKQNLKVDRASFFFDEPIEQVLILVGARFPRVLLLDLCKEYCRLVAVGIGPEQHIFNFSHITLLAPNTPQLSPLPECAARGASSPSPATLPAAMLRRPPYPLPATTPSSLPAPSKS